MGVFSLTLVRHGETVANKSNIIQGQKDTKLSDRGIQQAKLVAKRLENEKYTHIFSSDLMRAATTADMIIKVNRHSHSPLVKDARLRERKFGVVEGKTYNDLMLAARKANKAPANFTPDGGETLKQVHERSVNFFHDLCKQMQVYQQNETDKTVLPHDNANHCDMNSPSHLNNTSECDSTSASLDVQMNVNKELSPPLQLGDEATSEDTKPADIDNLFDVSHDDPDHTPEVVSSRETSPNFDATAAISNSIADILLVSHGGFIREIIRHFMDDFGCKVPGGKASALKVSPNTGVSRFVISTGEVCKIHCLVLHDKDHLGELCGEQAPGLY